VSVPVEWEERYHVRSYEVEPDGRLRVVVLARMLQETTWEHAIRLGWGLVERGEGKLFWVLSRLRIHMKRYPAWGDDFTVRTWPVGTENILAVRDFLVLDGADSVIGTVTTGWLIVDGTSGRPLRPQQLVGGVQVSPSRHDGDLSRVPSFDGGAVTDVRDVRYHDIDQYRHVNNTAYLEWLIDAVATDADLPEIERLDIDFMKETLLGDSYQVRQLRTENTTLCEVIRPDAGNDRSATGDDPPAACRARITWKE
jgi:acyl-ACP thioesterase